MLADKLLDMNIYELQYFNQISSEKIMKTSSISPMKLNVDWPSVKPDGKNTNFLIFQRADSGHLLTLTGSSSKRCWLNLAQ